jgi:hypothetical protein
MDLAHDPRSPHSPAAKASLRAVPVALTFAPGLGIGHGVLFPAGLALLIEALTPARRTMPADFAVFSILAARALIALGLFIKYRFYDARHPSKTGP